MATFAEISPSEFLAKYRVGYSINEIAKGVGLSYTGVRNELVRNGVLLRTKKQGTAVFLDRHPDWSSQFIKYQVVSKGQMSETKALLLTSVITEGYLDMTSVGFTNTQEQLHADFARELTATYGTVRIGRNGITSRISSTEISKDLQLHLHGKTFSEDALGFVVARSELCRKVLRKVADTEGSMIIALRKAPRNFTVECRIVLATSSVRFANQLQLLLTTLGIASRRSVDGVMVGRKSEILKFIELIGFSPGIKVIRRKAGLGTWFGREKFLLSKLCMRLYREQRIARAMGSFGCFADCSSREKTLSKLNRWYQEEMEVVN